MYNDIELVSISDATSDISDEEEEIHFPKVFTRINILYHSNWILRVGDGTNLINSSIYKIWGIQSNTSFGKHFLENVKRGDRLWFIKTNTNGKAIAVATYNSHNSRTISNEELGWYGEGPNWISDVEINYSRLYDLSEFNILTYIKGSATIRKYNEKCLVNLDREYSNIVLHSKIKIKL